MALEIVGYIVDGAKDKVAVLFDKDNKKENCPNGCVFVKNGSLYHEIGELGVYANLEVFMACAENAGWFERA